MIIPVNSRTDQDKVGLTRRLRHGNEFHLTSEWTQWN